MIDRLVTGRRDPLPLTQQLSGCLPDTSASWEVQMLNVAVKWGVFWVESNESYSLRLRCKKVQKRARKKKKSEAQIQYFGWKPAPCRFNRVVNWKMEQRDVWEGVGRVAKGWVPLHGSGTVGEASHSAASSLTCPRVRAKASMSRPYQLISKPMEAFPPTVHSHSVQRDGLIPAFFYSLLTTPDLLSSEPPAPTFFFSHSPSFKQRGRKACHVCHGKTDMPPNKIAHKLKVIFNKWLG